LELKSEFASIFRNNREEYEDEHRGGYERIFPSFNPELNEIYMSILKASSAHKSDIQTRKFYEK
jgi:hypothetical protein